MAKEYIEREAFLAELTKRYCEPCEAEGKDHNHVRCRACWVDDMMGEIGDAPFAADVVEVVRCKDCEWWEDCSVESYCHNPYGLDNYALPDDFCSNGKRRDSDGTA